MRTLRTIAYIGFFIAAPAAVIKGLAALGGQSLSWPFVLLVSACALVSQVVVLLILGRRRSR
ncbi:hypothetical protein [Micromonospora sp. NPDC005652]|uniref:hypothetical protein n=1 Tax=Micromonospora sp. NPDC005652 TaxID=3157046 RepID=UPI0033C9AC9C